MKTKKIIGTGKRLIMVLSVLALMLFCTMPTYAKSEEELTTSSQYITVTGKQMHVVLYGQLCQTEETVVFEDEQNTTLVMLPGLGETSPAIAMKPLAEALQEEFNVIIIEPFGYGLSALTDTARTTEHINQELNEVLETMEVDECVLLTHSIAGVYGLRFIADYPNKVEGFIAIDNTVCEPSVIESLAADEEMRNLLTSFNETRNSFSSIQEFKDAITVNPEKYGAILPEVAGYTYSAEDQIEYIEAYANSLNVNIENEFDLVIQNIKEIEGMKFPDSLPVLMFVASSNVEEIPDWKTGHLKQINLESGNHTFYQWEGSHALWFDDCNGIAECIRNWQFQH